MTPTRPDPDELACQLPGCNTRPPPATGRLEIPPGWYVRWAYPPGEQGAQGAGHLVVFCPEHRPAEGRG